MSVAWETGRMSHSLCMMCSSENSLPLVRIEWRLSSLPGRRLGTLQSDVCVRKYVLQELQEVCFLPHSWLSKIIYMSIFIAFHILYNRIQLGYILLYSKHNSSRFSAINPLKI